MMSKDTPGITPPVVNKLNFDVMTEYVENLLLSIAPKIYDLNSNINHTFLT